MRLETVHAAIREQGATWQAGATHVSALDDQERRRHLGLQINEAMQAQNREAIQAVNAAFRAVSAPPGVDWRNNGGNWITPVKDQQNCGSCVSFGTCGTVEARARIVCANAGLNIDLSENQLFFCGCGNCCDTGWTFEAALTYAQNTGIAIDADSPYTPVDKPCPGATPRVRITSWRPVYAMDDRKASLASKGPMLAGMTVYEDFFHYQGGVYQHVSGDVAGGHAVCCVGYSDADQCWICKNSWGTGFGEGGFFRIRYGDASGMDTDFPFYEAELTCPDLQPQIDCREYLPLLQRVLVAARSSRGLRAALRFYICGRGRQPTPSPAQARIVRAVQTILNQCPQYEAPFCRSLR
jgi:C1A family cysteine protease